MNGKKRYAGEGMRVHEAGTSLLSRLSWQIKRIVLWCVGRKPKASDTLNRDFYAAITSDTNYIILGESRYGIESRMASLKKELPKPPKRKAA
ncbi:MAG: hypothetical protein H7249_09795 [Chitinophagaceae bacterium]|nr:hypothetical protein [Oligoflexus sp.]